MLLRGRRGQRGAVLIFSYLLVLFIVMFQSALMLMTLNEQRAADLSRNQLRAFHVAEAGIDDAFARLKSPTSGYWSACTTLTTTDYTVQCTAADPFRTVVSTGTYANTISGPSTVLIKAQLQRFTPPNVLDKAVYAAGTATFTGNAYSVVGDVLVGGSLPSNTGNVQGEVISDPSASQFPALDYAQLYTIAQGQGNVYDQNRLNAIQNHTAAFPSSFCYNPLETAPNCVPNINYLEGDMVLNGNIGTIGGMFVVVGDVLTDPTATDDATINGNGQIAGVIYTTGQFRINGGGSGLNIDGGVLVGADVVLKGSATVQYNASYMQSIKNLHINPSVQTVFWEQCPPSGCP